MPICCDVLPQTEARTFAASLAHVRRKKNLLPPDLPKLALPRSDPSGPG
jgi:hypothetical protein